jgi:hypothetical protein
MLLNTILVSLNQKYGWTQYQLNLIIEQIDLLTSVTAITHLLKEKQTQIHDSFITDLNQLNTISGKFDPFQELLTQGSPNTINTLEGFEKNFFEQISCISKHIDRILSTLNLGDLFR